MTAGQGRTRPADVVKELTIHEYIEETVEHHIEEEETMFKVARQVVSPRSSRPWTICLSIAAAG